MIHDLTPKIKDNLTSRSLKSMRAVMGNLKQELDKRHFFITRKEKKGTRKYFKSILKNYFMRIMKLNKQVKLFS